jgi:argininosuccinate lyase
MVKTIKANAGRIRDAIKKDYILATDIADYLVKKGLPFREAHGVVAKLSKYAINQDKSFHELSLSEYQNFSTLFSEDVYDVTLESSVAARNIIGGTAPEQIEAQIKRARKILSST